MLYEAIREAMLRHPGQLITDAGGQQTYRALLAEAEALGKTLTRHKYGILCRSELAETRALLSCLSAGKTAVPLSARYGEAHNKKIVEAIRLTHLITDEGVVQAAEEQPEEEDLSDTALILCTSGTTGTPKGAMLTEEGVYTNLTDIAGYFAVGESDHLLIARPLCHCAVLAGELLLGLLKGVRISFSPDGFAPASLLRQIREEGITVLGGTPTLFFHLAALQCRSKGPLPLQKLAISGECMTEAAANRMREAFPAAAIYHVYGLTEAGPRVSRLMPEEFDAHPLSVGRPLPSQEVRIEDGELLVRGKSIMKGYYRSPTGTAAALREGWLHTGDLACRDEAGRIRILGRKDDLIIRSGMNIYPQELENVLKQEEQIVDVLAYGVPDPLVGQKIHLDAVTVLSRAAVYALCREKLPGYMLPDEIAIVPQLARNPSGKIRRHQAEPGPNSRTEVTETSIFPPAARSEARDDGLDGHSPDKPFACT